MARFVTAIALSMALSQVLPAGAALAQNVGVTQSPVVVLDTEQVFGATLIGRAIAKELEDKVRALAAENRKITAELEAEELELTEKRKTLDPETFRKLADAFDEKVQRIRQEQDAKQRELQRLRDAERQSFLDNIAPILSAIAQEHGAFLVLERRNVLLSAGSIDITRKAITRINQVFGGGGATPEPAPETQDSLQTGTGKATPPPEE